MAKSPSGRPMRVSIEGPLPQPSAPLPVSAAAQAAGAPQVPTAAAEASRQALPFPQGQQPQAAQAAGTAPPAPPPGLPGRAADQTSAALAELTDATKAAAGGQTALFGALGAAGTKFAMLSRAAGAAGSAFESMIGAASPEAARALHDAFSGLESVIGRTLLPLVDPLVHTVEDVTDAFDALLSPVRWLLELLPGGTKTEEERAKDRTGGARDVAAAARTGAAASSRGAGDVTDFQAFADRLQAAALKSSMGDPEMEMRRKELKAMEEIAGNTAVAAGLARGDQARKPIE